MGEAFAHQSAHILWALVPVVGLFLTAHWTCALLDFDVFFLAVGRVFALFGIALHWWVQLLCFATDYIPLWRYALCFWTLHSGAVALSETCWILDTAL